MTMRTAYRVLAYLLALSVAVQASLIAFGTFALENKIDKGPVSDGDTTGVEAYRFRRQLYYATCAILVSIPSSYSEGVRYPSPF